MPTASDEQRDLMEKWFGDAIDDRGPLDLLFSHGFTEKAGMIYPPLSAHTINYIEWECIRFLIDEWDYGWSRGEDGDV